MFSVRVILPMPIPVTLPIWIPNSWWTEWGGGLHWGLNDLGRRICPPSAHAPAMINFAFFFNKLLLWTVYWVELSDFPPLHVEQIDHGIWLWPNGSTHQWFVAFPCFFLLVQSLSLSLTLHGMIWSWLPLRKESPWCFFLVEIHSRRGRNRVSSPKERERRGTVRGSQWIWTSMFISFKRPQCSQDWSVTFSRTLGFHSVPCLVFAPKNTLAILHVPLSTQNDENHLHRREHFKATFLLYQKCKSNTIINCIDSVTDQTHWFIRMPIVQWRDYFPILAHLNKHRGGCLRMSNDHLVFGPFGGRGFDIFQGSFALPAFSQSQCVFYPSFLGVLVEMGCNME